MQKNRGRSFTPYLYLLPVIALFAILLLYPMVEIIHYSLLDKAITSKNPAFTGLENYKYVLTDDTFWTALSNSLIFTIVSVVAHICLGMAFALIINSENINVTIRNIFRALFILPWTLTVTIVAILWRLILNSSGVLNQLFFENSPIDWFGSSSTALAAVIFVNIWCGYPFYMVSFLAGMQGISRDLYEAATIDGAGAFRQFTAITLPQLKPVILSLFTLDFIWTMQQMSLVWMTTGGGPIHSSEVMGTYTYKLAFENMRFSRASASAVIILVICMILCFFYLKLQSQRED